MNNELTSQLLRDPLRTTIQYYAQCLPTAPKAVEYIQRMALSSDAALRVGFSDRTLGTHIPSKTTKLGRELRERLQSLGVLKENGREVFRGMITLPLQVAGQVTGIFGLRLDRHSKEPAQIISGSGIFNVQALEQFDELIITDNLLDAWAFYSAGYRHVICAVNHQLTIAECAKLRRVLLTAETIDCEAFSKCEIHRLHYPEGQSAHDLWLARRTQIHWAICSERLPGNRARPCNYPRSHQSKQQVLSLQRTHRQPLPAPLHPSSHPPRSHPLHHYLNQSMTSKRPSPSRK